MYIKKILLFILLAGLVVGGIFAYKVYGAIFTPNTNINKDKVYIYISSDATFEDVQDSLRPFIKNIESFAQIAQKKGYTTNVKGGKYEIAKGMNNNDIINSLRSNNVAIKLAFNNQETLADLAGRISDQIEPDSISLLNSFQDPAFLKANGFDDDDKLAMYIPNSYEFFWNTSADKFRGRMLKEYHRFWNEDRLKKAKSMGYTPNQVVALASIVHKETAKIDERPRVAGLYLNRLNKGILLQADPTVIYALKKHAGNFDMVIKRVLYKDLEIDSPYNTYKNPGIPPGPITMPDISAIDAVLNAEKHGYYYMVANVKNFGYHKFAKTLSQHNQNKVQYIRWINEQKIIR